MLFLVGFMLLMGLVDSLNPFTITVQILLLGTLKNVNRIAIYISGILVIYLVGGIAIFTGLSTIFNYLIEQFLSIPELVLYSIQLILGVILVVYGFIALRKSNESKQLPNNPGVSTWALISLGAGVTLVADLPTAMPYFAFIAKMTEMRVDIIIGVTFLLAYSIIYVLPLIITWALYLKFQDKIKSRMAFVVAKMEKVNKYIIVGFCVVGILLIIDSVLFYVGIPIKW
ncbi:hypothetical protein B9J78_00005 [bacterium Unc6]|nr:hypothetical protein [bacterium Unc6]